MYDTALAALATDARARARHAAPLALAAAEAELGCHGGVMSSGPAFGPAQIPNPGGGRAVDPGAAARALHLLAWLAGGGPYERLKPGAKGALPAPPDAARSRPLCVVLGAWCGRGDAVHHCLGQHRVDESYCARSDSVKCAPVF